MGKKSKSKTHTSSNVSSSEITIEVPVLSRFRSNNDFFKWFKERQTDLIPQLSDSRIPIKNRLEALSKYNSAIMPFIFSISNEFKGVMNKGNAKTLRKNVKD